MRQAPSFAPPPPAVTLGSFAVGAAGLGAAVGALPLAVAGGIAVGIPTLTAAILSPRVGLALLLFSIPFSSWTKVSFGPYDVTATDALVAIVLLAWIGRSIARHRFDIQGGPTIGAALFLLGAEVISTATAASFSSSVKEMLKLGELIALAAYGASNLRRTGDTQFVVCTFLAAGVCEACVGLFQFVTGRGPANFEIGPFIRAYGDFAQPNAFAGYLAMTLPFAVVWCFLPGRLRPVAIGATGVLGIALAASLSRGAWLGTAIGVAVMAMVWTRQAKRVVGAAVLITLLLIPAAKIGVIPGSVAERISVVLDNYWIFDASQVQPDPDNWAIVERMAHWQAAWNMAMDHPITGVGPGNYETVYPDYFLPGWVEALGHAHNLYLNMFAELGIVGLIAFVTFTVAIFVRIAQALRLTRNPAVREATSRQELLRRRALLVAGLGAAVTFSVHNTFDNMFIHGMGVQFGLILGLVEAQYAVLRAEITEPESTAADVVRAPAA